MLRDTAVKTQTVTPVPTILSQGEPSDLTQEKAPHKSVDITQYAPLAEKALFTLKVNKNRDAHSVAARTLTLGTEVMQDKAAAAIVRTAFTKQVCDMCFAPLPVVPADAKEPSGTPCDQCEFVRYCSEDCRAKATPYHQEECSVSGKLEAIREKHKVDVDLLRLVLRVLALYQTQDSAAKPVANEFTPVRFIEDLPSRKEAFEETWIKTITDAMDAFIAVLPGNLATLATSDFLIGLACRISIHSQGFADPASRRNNDCIGLFPLTAQFINHSCLPNAYLVSKANGRVAIRTLQEVPEGQALTVSYVDLFQPREQRRRDLLMTRHFWCQCRRCNELLSSSVDRYMDGILCRKCKFGVMIFEETKEVNDINALMTDTSILDKEIRGKKAECESCKAKIPVADLVKVLKQAIEDYAGAIMLVRQRRLPEARKALETYLQTYERGELLHFYNSYLLNVLIPLMNTCVALNDVHAAVTYNKAILKRMALTNALPRVAPETGEFWYHLGDLYNRLANTKLQQSRNPTKSVTILINRYLKEAKAAYVEAHKIFNVAYGKAHPKTQLALQRRKLKTL
ncbi:hypothetical protein IWQ61_005809 [Dispira simplex]|nr:hypothetical protein IWQ61_005809 [Dispira simplex]